MSAQLKHIPANHVEQAPIDPFLLSLVSVIREGLIRDHYVRLHRFGSFRLKWTKPSTRKHPKTGRLIHYASQPRVYFSPAKNLREIIANGNITATVHNFTGTHKPAGNISVTEHYSHVSSGRQNKAQTRRSLLLPAALITAVPLILMLLNSNLPVDRLAGTGQVPDSGNTNSVATFKHENRPASIARKTRHKTIYLQPQIHVIAQGDSLWTLASTYLGDPLLWPYIYRANRNTLDNPNRLSVNSPVVIPGLRQPADNLHAIDRRLVADGYMLLYEYYLSTRNNKAYDYLLGARRFDSGILQRRYSGISVADRKRLNLASPI